MSGSKTTLSRVGIAPATEIVDPLLRQLAPIRINLLPHREMRRERRKKDFLGLAGLVAIGGAVAAFTGGFAINQQISAQQDRNTFIQTENRKLDAEIAEIKTLREEIAALRARQEAVENLQSDRTLPVRLFDELVRLAPEGVYLKQLKHDDAKIELVGIAQTNERVAELLRNLTDRSPWLEKPAVGEIKEIAQSSTGTAGKREERKVFEFSLNALVKKPAKPVEPQRPGAPRTTGDPGSKSAATEPIKLGAAR